MNDSVDYEDFKRQVTAIYKAADMVHTLGKWKPGDPYMEQFIGNCRFLGWCDDFGREIKKICDKCPYKLKHEQIWYDEEMTDGVPANEICLKYREIGSVHDTFQVAKTCRFIDHTKFGVYVKEMQAYIDSFK